MCLSLWYFLGGQRGDQIFFMYAKEDQKKMATGHHKHHKHHKWRLAITNLPVKNDNSLNAKQLSVSCTCLICLTCKLGARDLSNHLIFSF